MPTDEFRPAPKEAPRPLPDLNIRLICKECRTQPPNIIERFSDGDLVCADCGLVLGDRIIDTRSEWRTFADEDDDPSRVGSSANPFLAGTQLDTIISKRDGGSGVARRLARAHGRASTNHGQLQLVEAHNEIVAMCDHAGLSKAVADTAKKMYVDAVESKKKFILKREALIAGCIYTACRSENVGRTFKEIAAITRVRTREIGRAFRHLRSILSDNFRNTSSLDLIARFCSKRNLSKTVKSACVKVTKEAEHLEALAGKSPVTVASACIYMVAGLYGEPRAAKDISKVTGISEVTIKSAYNSLHQSKERLVAVTDG